MTKMTTSIPSSSCEMPNDNRASPDSWSMPTSPNARPRKRLKSPRAIDEPSSTDTVVNATTVSAKYSAGPKRSANDARGGAKNASATVASVPATNDPMAAVDVGDDGSCLAWSVQQDAGGGCAIHRPVVDAGKHDERAGGFERECHRKEQCDRQRWADAREHTNGGAECDAGKCPDEVWQRQGAGKSLTERVQSVHHDT